MINPDEITLSGATSDINSEISTNSTFMDDKEIHMTKDIFEAAKNGNIGELHSFMQEEGFDIEARMDGDMTALMHAACNGHTDVVALLLKNGAEVNAKTFFGNLALMDAACNGHTDVVALLLENGAEVNAQVQDGHTALTYAACNGHTDVIALLLDNGADVNAQDNKGNTVLIYAAGSGNAAAIDLVKAHTEKLNQLASFIKTEFIDQGQSDCSTEQRKEFFVQLSKYNASNIKQALKEKLKLDISTEAEAIQLAEKGFNNIRAKVREMDPVNRKVTIQGLKGIKLLPDVTTIITGYLSDSEISQLRGIALPQEANSSQAVTTQVDTSTVAVGRTEAERLAEAAIVAKEVGKTFKGSNNPISETKESDNRKPSSRSKSPPSGRG